MTPVAVAAAVLPHDGGLPSQHATLSAAGVDRCAAVAALLVLGPGARATVPTGIAVALPASVGDAGGLGSTSP